MVPCETNFRQQCQPDEEKNWERQFPTLLTPALMGDPFGIVRPRAIFSVQHAARVISKLGRPHRVNHIGQAVVRLSVKSEDPVPVSMFRTDPFPFPINDNRNVHRDDSGDTSRMRRRR